jgi:hypothetical protein
MSLCLPASHSFGYPLGDLLFLCSANLVQVHALRHQLLQHLAHEILVDILGVEVRGTQQGAQTGLVFDGAGRYDGSRGRCAGWLLAGRAPVVARAARLSAAVAASLPPPALSRGLQAGPAAARDAHVPQAQLLGLVEHALVGVVALIAPPELGQHIVARLVPVAVCLFLFGALAALGVRLEEDVEEGGDGGIGLCGAHRGAA